MTYDVYGNQRTKTDHLGNTAVYTYDANHNPLTETDPLGNTVAQTYTSFGQSASVTDPRGQVYVFDYDEPLQEPTRVYNPMDADSDGQLDHVDYTYDALGRQTSITDPNGNTTSFIYDDGGRLLSQTDALGNTIEYTYDAAGRLLETREPNGAIFSTAYTPTGQPKRETDPLGNVTSYAYDEEDRPISVTDPLGRITRYEYDAAGRPTSLDTCDATTTTCQSVGAEYDEAGNLIRLIDPESNEITFEHDLLGRVTRETNEAGESVSYAYDGRGLLTSFTNARGQLINYEYDDAGRQTSINLPGGSITHTLDANGNAVSSSSDLYASVSRVFDAMDRLVERTDDYGNTIRYQYDPAGNLRALTYSDGSKVVYSYDELNRLERLEDWHDPANPPSVPIVAGECEASAYCRVTTYGYDDVGNLTLASLPDGSTVTYIYDLARRMTAISDTNAVAGTVFAAGYTIDSASQLAAAQVELPLDPQLALAVRNLGYNTLNQVVSCDAHLYAYDADGNLTSGFLGGAAITASYDALNQLAQINGDTFRYDVDGLRVEATRSGVTRRYIHDPTAELSRLLEEHDGNGDLVTRYVYGLGLVSREDAGGLDYRVYHYDTRGSTVALTDDTGTITDVYAYDTYGKLAGYEDRTPGDPETANPFRYNGRDGVFDDGNGLYYMRARYYAPELMRFIQHDVIDTELRGTQSLNRYAFAQGNPIQMVDPNGYFFGLDDLFAAIAGAIAGAFGQFFECAVAGFEGDACSGEEFGGAIIGGAVGGWASLYVGPVVGGAIGGAIDGFATWGFRAIPGGAEELSWQEGLTGVAMGAGIGALGGVAGGKAAKGLGVDKAALKAATKNFYGKSTKQMLGELGGLLTRRIGAANIGKASTMGYAVPWAVLAKPAMADAWR